MIVLNRNLRCNQMVVVAFFLTGLFFTNLLQAQTPACVPALPTMELIPAVTEVPAGATVNYLISIVNNDSIDCSPRNFVMSSVIPSGFSAFFDQPSFTLAPAGAMLFQNYHFTSPVTAPPGDYSVVVQIADASNPSAILAESIGLFRVQTPTTACVAVAPAILITPETNSGLTGTSLNYTVSITNQDSLDCTATNFFISGIFLAGFGGQFLPPEQVLSPGQSINVSLVVNSSLGLTPGYYPFTVAVTDPNQPLHNVNAVGNFQILAPEPPAVPAPVITSAKVNCHKVSLTWTQAAGGLAPITFDIFVDGIKIGQTKKLSASFYLFRGTHTITLRARDANGVQSGFSSPVTVRIK